LPVLKTCPYGIETLEELLRFLGGRANVNDA
jgi:hypothetical protein